MKHKIYYVSTARNSRSWNNKLRRFGIYLLFSSMSFMYAKAQTFVNGNLTIHSGDTLVDFSQKLAVGENANLQIDGVWYLGSDTLEVHPNATITGSGTILFADHSNLSIGTQPLTSRQEVEVEGNMATLDCDVKVENTKNMELIQSGIRFTKDIELAASDVHIILNANDLVLGSSATISNATENQYVVTNSTGSLVKEDLSTRFIFPVGNKEGTLATQDYTPCALTNSGTADTFAVRVAATVNSGSSSGVDHVNRQWHISERKQGGSNVKVELQHNDNSEETEYNDQKSYVAQYIGAAPNSNGGSVSNHEWDLDRTAISAGSGSGTITSGTAISTASVQDRSFTDFYTYNVFTKLSNGDHCLAAKAFLQAPLMGTGTSVMHDSLRAKSLIPLTEPYTGLTAFTHYGNGGNEQTTSAILSTTGNNAVVDWLILDLIDKTNNQNILESQSVLLQRDGDIISALGDDKVCFTGLTTDSFYVGIRHRNHLPIQTANYHELDEQGPTIDLSSISLYGTNSTVTISSKKAMWAGDPTSNDEVIFSGANEDGAQILNSVLGHTNNTFNVSTFAFSGYNRNDVNMDGSVIYSGLKNDVDLIKNNVINHPGNTFKSPTYKIENTRP